MGARKLLEEKITELMQALPDEELEGVVFYLENIRARKKDEVLKNIHELAGSFRNYLTPSDEFSRRKQEEKKLDR